MILYTNIYQLFFLLILLLVYHMSSIVQFIICRVQYNSVLFKIKSIQQIVSRMSKQIEMEQIVEQDNIVTTQIFDSSMPSSIDFDNPNDGTSQKPNIQSEKKIPEMGKVLVIGDQMVSFSVKGKLIKQLQPKYLPGVPITVSLNTLPVKMQDQQASSLMKLWSSLVGHSRRQVLIEQGYMYILQKQKQGLYVRATFNLSSLFKLFVDPQEQRVRLVIRQQQNVITRDLYPDNFIVMTERIQHELVQIGLSLVQ